MTTEIDFKNHEGSLRFATTNRHIWLERVFANWELIFGCAWSSPFSCCPGAWSSPFFCSPGAWSSPFFCCPGVWSSPPCSGGGFDPFWCCWFLKGISKEL